MNEEVVLVDLVEGQALTLLNQLENINMAVEQLQGFIPYLQLICFLCMFATILIVGMVVKNVWSK